MLYRWTNEEDSARPTLTAPGLKNAALEGFQMLSPASYHCKCMTTIITTRDLLPLTPLEIKS